MDDDSVTLKFCNNFYVCKVLCDEISISCMLDIEYGKNEVAGVELAPCRSVHSVL